MRAEEHKVRFHLGRGPHFRHWQVRSKDGGVRYYEPAKTRMLLVNPITRRHNSTAQKIFRGDITKTVCAWLGCRAVSVWQVNGTEPTPTIDLSERTRLSFDPHENPRWRVSVPSTDGYYPIRDDAQYRWIAVIGTELYPCTPLFSDDQPFFDQFLDPCTPVPYPFRLEGATTNAGV